MSFELVHLSPWLQEFSALNNHVFPGIKPKSPGPQMQGPQPELFYCQSIRNNKRLKALLHTTAVMQHRARVCFRSNPKDDETTEH